MKRRIEQLLNGKFEYEVKPPILSRKEIAEAGAPGDILTGFFDVDSPSEKKLKGFLYSSNPRVIFDPPEFNGTKNRILYQVDTCGLQPGEAAVGSFTLCTDRGEYALPYRFAIRKEETEKPQAARADQLLTLAEHDPEKARRALLDPAYEKWLMEKDREKALLYKGLVRREYPGRSLEEYLIGCGLKEPVDLSLEETVLEIKAPEQSVRQTVRLRKSSWGYLEIELSSDARFLRLEKKRITTDDFVGDDFLLDYIIDTNFLHAGKNLGRIRVSSCYQTLYLEIQVSKAANERTKSSEQRTRRLMRKRLLELYVDFRLRRIEMQAWIDRSVSAISSYRRAGGTDIFAELFLVQLYFADGKRMKGYRLLQELENAPGRFQEQEQYGFYLYLTTFFERDAQYVDQVEQRISEMQSRRRDSWILQWILLYLQEKYLKDDGAKLEAICRQVELGCHSPIMYLEAACLFRKDPYLLRRLDLTARKILLFAAKEKMITDELASHVGNLAMQGEEFDRKIYHILKSCYEATRGRDCLKAICSLLIAADKREAEYFHWYALAVQADLRITGLYEYYMETMDTVSVEQMPQIIRMYFSYSNTLDYHKKAAIYRGIADRQEDDPQAFHTSRSAIEDFLVEQLSLGRIDQDLAALYERFITRKLLTRVLAEKLVKLLFTFEVTCKNPQMKSVIVVHENRKGEQETPLTGGRALVQIYTEHARIFLADDRGNRYASSSLYLAERFLDAPALLACCQDLIPAHPALTMYVTGRGDQIGPLTLPCYKRAAQMEELTDDFRESCRRRILAYYLDHPREEGIYRYLKEIDYGPFIEAGKKELMTLLTREGMYEEAFGLLERYGSEDLEPLCLVRICSQSVLAKEYDKNEALLSYCWQCFSCGKYDDNILTYLLMYYDGPIEEMKRLWNTGRSNELDTMTLEEKILTLLLFTRAGSSGTEPIFWSYEHRLGRRKICRAYVVLKSYEYLVKNLPVSELIFTALEKSYERGEELEDVSMLALLQHYAGLPDLTEQRRQIVRELLTKYNGRGIRFAFYQRFPRKMRQFCQLEDKVFFEYVANPEHTVILYYRREGEEKFHPEIMQNSFEGIFVREFILFATEAMECYTEEYDAEMLLKTSGRRTLTHEMPRKEDTSRFALLCRMSGKEKEGDREGLEKDLANYRQMEELTEEIFTLI